MDHNLVDRGRRINRILFGGVVEALVKQRITPNQISVISLIVGVGAIYYLFTNHVLFIILTVLHFFFDMLDGMLARRIGTDLVKGKMVDQGVDRMVAFLFLLKSHLYFPSAVTLTATILYAAYTFIYFAKSMRSTYIPGRTWFLLIAITTWYELAWGFAILISIFGTIDSVMKK